MFKVMILVLCGILMGAVMDAGPAVVDAADVTDEIHTVLPRDAIPAILRPEFVGAQEARVDDAAAMIGVVFNAEAHAYSAVLLNTNEIVNDVVGGRKIATTW